MKTKLVLLLVTLLLHASWLRAQGTAFTYQGRLNENGSPANGSYDLQFSLRDAAAGGNPVSGTNTLALVSVSNGLFIVTLDFGAGIFTGDNRWLEIGVKSNGVAGAHTHLTPLQLLTPSPYAIFAGGAQTASTVATGGVSAASLALGAVNSGAIADGSIQSDDLSSPLLNGTFWRLGGNSGTTPGANFIGTSDNQPLELSVNGSRALRIEPNTNGAPNLIGGAPVNVVDAGIIGAAIGGGGAANYFGTSFTNRIAANFGVIADGILNTIEIGAGSSIIGGGAGHIIRTNSSNAVIAGGQNNSIEENSPRSFIGGGLNNHVEPNSRHSTIGGGIANGFPLSVIAGRADVMRLFTEVFFSTTHGGEALSLAACLATLTELRSKDVIGHLRRVGGKLKEETNRLAAQHGLARNVECAGLPAWTTLRFCDAAGKPSLLLRSLFQQEALKRGLLTHGNHMLSFNHDEAVIELTLRAYDEIFAILADALQRNVVEQSLEGEPLQPVIRQSP